MGNQLMIVTKNVFICFCAILANNRKISPVDEKFDIWYFPRRTQSFKHVTHDRGICISFIDRKFITYQTVVCIPVTWKLVHSNPVTFVNHVISMFDKIVHISIHRIDFDSITPFIDEACFAKGKKNV